MMQNRFFFAVVFLLLSGCATVPPQSPQSPRTGVSTFAGFDTNLYPGEQVLQAWRASSPYRWIGYYLPAPCHRETSWVGKRPTLERLGWGIAVLYVGQQAFEGDTTTAAPAGPIICSRTLLSAEQGRTDAADAIQRAQAEGFAPGTIVYLDVELMRQIPQQMVAYYQAWIRELLRDGRYVPGTYAHRNNSSALYSLAEAAFREAGRTDTPPFWIAGGAGFSLDQRAYGSGFPYAAIWQGALDVDRTWGGMTLRIDENVANRASPSAPLQP